MKKILALLSVTLMATGGLAARPIQLSLTPEIALYDRSETIEGLTLNVWGENPQTGLALGIVNGSTGRSAGLSWALILNYAEDYTGVQWAIANYTKGDFLGWQGGGVNYAGKLTGLQLGFVNYAQAAASGVQIGLVNIIPENTAWFSELPKAVAPGMIFVNWRF